MLAGQTVSAPLLCAVRGVLTTADTLPAGVLYRGGRATTVAVSVAQENVGQYSMSFMVPAEWQTGEHLRLLQSATVQGLPMLRMLDVGKIADPLVTPDVIAVAVWDEHLTGSTHNVAGSAGKRLRQLADTVVLAEGVGSGMVNVTGVGYITLAVGTTTQCVYQAIRVGDMVRFIRAFDPPTRVATLDMPWCTVTAGAVDYTLFNLRESTTGATPAQIREEMETVGGLLHKTFKAATSFWR